MTRAIGPPLELSVVEEDLTGVEHLFSFRNRWMPVTIVQQHFTFTRAHEVVLLVGNIHAVTALFMQTILTGETV